MKNEQTIVQNVELTYAFPYDDFDPEIIALFQKGLLIVSPDRPRAILALLNCFLKITNTRLTKENLNNQEWVEEFVGALYSPSFWRSTDAHRAQAVRLFGQLLENTSVCTEIQSYLRTRTQQAQIVQMCIEKFNNLNLDQEAVWLITGWRTTNRAGHVLWLPLLPFYRQFGKAFVDDLYHACNIYFSGQRNGSIPGLLQLGEFILTLPSIKWTRLSRQICTEFKILP